MNDAQARVDDCSHDDGDDNDKDDVAGANDIDNGYIDDDHDVARCAICCRAFIFCYM